MTAAAKRPFLVAYDYGAGGLWGFVLARSAAEIADAYPELVVDPEHPAWMTAEELARMARLETHDIDDAPAGLLQAVVADRDRS